MELLKRCCAAFVVGGALGLLGQITFVLVGLIPGLEPRFVVYATLILMGVFALITFPLGLYQKLLEAGGFGAMLQFSGFVAAMADTYEQANRSKDSLSKALVSCGKLFLTVFGIGTVLALIVSALVFYIIQGGEPVILVTHPPVGNVLIELVLAFLVCGVLSALFQLFMMLSNLEPPVILVIGFALGSIMVPLGVLDWLQAIGGAGAFITVMAAGGAAGSSLLALFAGNITPIIEILVVFVSLAVIGCLAGALTVKRTSGVRMPE